MNTTAQSWHDNMHFTTAAGLPPHCTPTHPYLVYISKSTGTCIPTPLALLSVTLGTLSIISWLFAQIPQLYKNYTLKTTSGLSIYFLVEWCAGDISNLVGGILTRQASWQIIIGAYYTFVDCALVAQWIWYEKLKHGRPVRMLWRKKGATTFDTGSPTMLVYDGIEDTSVIPNEPIIHPKETLQQSIRFTPDASPAKPKEIPRHRQRMGMFAVPNYGSFQSVNTVMTRAEDDGASIAESPRMPRRINRLRRKDDMPSPSPRTVLFISMLVLALSHVNASPLPHPSPSSINLLTTSAASSPTAATPVTTISSTTSWARTTLGPLLSWTSTTLYLISRLPQLLKNLHRRSTHGLSISLFLAAFAGNLFYSASMLANPLAWSSYGPHGCHGWVGASGSDRAAWVGNASPFFLGAAGVLLLDAAMAGQFWWFGREEKMRVQAEKEEEERRIAKASVVSERLDSERTLVSSRDGGEARNVLNKMIDDQSDAGNGKGTVKNANTGTSSTSPILGGLLRSTASGTSEPVLVVGTKVPLSDFDDGKFRWSWKEVDGWMRGWKPSYSNLSNLSSNFGGMRSGFAPTGTGRRKSRGKSRSGLGNEVGEGEGLRADMSVRNSEDVLEGSETQALLGEL